MDSPQHIPSAAPRAAYLHVPFCVHRCGYCSFTVVAGRDDLIESYLQALEAELRLLGSPQPVETLFFGGGTPTHLPPAELTRLLQLARHWFPVCTPHEISVEANPADLTEEKIEILAAHQVNRLSLGAQSFLPQTLTVLERDHTPQAIAHCVELARSSIASISIDLIFGVPGQTFSMWQDDLQQAIALKPQHISTYGLTWEKGTQFWNRWQHGHLQPVAEELEREMYAYAIDHLTQAGFEHYEVSNFARPGFRCRHNETYWSGNGYFAAGPGASRYVAGRRETNHRSTATWLKRLQQHQSPVAESECLTPSARARELAVFSLRRMEGLTRHDFFQRTGFDLDTLLGESLQKFVSLGFMLDVGDRIRLSRAGLFVSDALWPEFLEETK